MATLAFGCKGDVGEVCSDDSDCASELLCRSMFKSQTKQCTKSCFEGAGCDGGTECVLNGCGIPCSTDEICPAGTACSDFEFCEPVCESDVDCDDGTCVNGLCR